MPKSTMTNPSFRLRAVALAACCGILLVGCGGGSDESSNTVMAEEPMLDTAKAASEREAIEGAIASARNAVDAVDDTATDAEVQAAEDAIMAIETAIMNADNVPENEKSQFIGQHDLLHDALDDSKSSRDMAMEADQRQAIQDALEKAQNLVGALNDDATPEEVKAAEDAIDDLETAITNASNVSDKSGFTASQNTLQNTLDGFMDAKKDDQLQALEDALAVARNAVEKLEDADATDDDVEDAEDAIEALDAAIMNAEDVPENEKSTFVQEHSSFRNTLENEKRYEKNQKLSDGITLNDPNNVINIQYNRAGTAIDVTVGPAAAVPLMDHNMVEPNYGWEGKEYTATPDAGGTHKAVVYSNVEAPTQGKKFGSADEGDDYEYQLEGPEGGLAETEFDPEYIVFTDVTRTAGTEMFHLPADNPGNSDKIVVPGTYHGVDGIYTCEPATPAAGCSAAVHSGGGFTVSGVDTWEFIPDDPEERVTSTPDTIYLSYGWWMHTSEDGNTYTATAFANKNGDVPEAEQLGTLNGTAKYMGGAAGKYALSTSSSTDEIDDVGHFTAKVELNANFTEDSITGTINSFIGDDGMSRDWSVELKEADIDTSNGSIESSDSNGTVWTIGEMDADPSGEWSGGLYDEGEDGIPKVATGTFYSKYGDKGKMVGAFGVNVEEQ